MKSNVSGDPTAQGTGGQENRRPLLQRIFGVGQKQPTSNSVGAPINRAGSSTSGGILNRGKSMAAAPILHSSATTAAETIPGPQSSGGANNSMLGVSHVVSGSIGSRRSNIPPVSKANSTAENNLHEKNNVTSTSLLNGAKSGPNSTNGAPLNNQSAGSRSISRVR